MCPRRAPCTHRHRNRLTSPPPSHTHTCTYTHTYTHTHTCCLQVASATGSSWLVCYGREATCSSGTSLPMTLMFIRFAAWRLPFSTLLVVRCSSPTTDIFWTELQHTFWLLRATARCLLVCARTPHTSLCQAALCMLYLCATDCTHIHLEWESEFCLCLCSSIVCCSHISP
jgi:hypothetical protein